MNKHWRFIRNGSFIIFHFVTFFIIQPYLSKNFQTMHLEFKILNKNSNPSHHRYRGIFMTASYCMLSELLKLSHGDNLRWTSFATAVSVLIQSVPSPVRVKSSVNRAVVHIPNLRSLSLFLSLYLFALLIKPALQPVYVPASNYTNALSPASVSAKKKELFSLLWIITIGYHFRWSVRCDL